MQLIRRFAVLAVIRILLAAGATIGVSASHVTWPVTILAFTGAWPVGTAVRRLAHLGSPRSEFLEALGDAAAAAAIAMIVIFDFGNPWWVVILSLALVARACSRAARRENERWLASQYPGVNLRPDLALRPPWKSRRM